MANLALIRGARDAANKFVDVTGVIRQAVLRGEAALLRQDALERAEKEKSETFRLQLLARGDTLQKSKIAPEMQGYATNKAMQLQQQFRQTLLDPNVSKEDQVIALQNYNSQIDEITSFNQQFLEFQDNFRKLETSQLSDLNDAERLSNARMIATGQFQWDGENFILGQEENQKVVNAQQLFSEANQEIIKETVGYTKLLSEFQNFGLTQGYQKMDPALFEQMVDQKLLGSELNNMNTSGLASIVVDYISNESVDPSTGEDNRAQKQILKDALKQDYADDGLFNASSSAAKGLVQNSGLGYRDYLIKYIGDNVKKAVQKQYDLGFSKAPKDPSKPPTKEDLAYQNAAVVAQDVLGGIFKIYNEEINALPKNKAGIILTQKVLDDIKVDLSDPEGPSYTKLKSLMKNLGWYVSNPIYADDRKRKLVGVEFKNQAGTKILNVDDGDSLGPIVESLLLLEKIQRSNAKTLMKVIQSSAMEASLANAQLPTYEELLEIERTGNYAKYKMFVTDDEFGKVSNEFNSKK